MSIIICLIWQFNHVLLRACTTIVKITTTLLDMRRSRCNVRSIFLVFTAGFGLSVTVEIDSAIGDWCDLPGSNPQSCYEDDPGCYICSGSRTARIASPRRPQFKTNSFEIPPNSRDWLAEIAEEIKSIPAGAIIEVRGHTDRTGSREANLALSKQRAQAVRNALVSLGVPPDMLVVSGYGELGPIRNRTVSFSVIR